MMENEERPEAETEARRMAGEDWPVERVGRPLALRLAAGAVVAAVMIPLLFRLQFGEVGALGWGLTVFVAALCLLAAVALYAGRRLEYHTRVRPRDNWFDRLGSLWMVACAIGPFLGWLATSPAFDLTLANWEWRYTLRVALAGGLPLLTAQSLLRYARGRAALLGLPILVGVTALPLMTAVRPLRDLLEGPAYHRAVVIHLGDGDCRLEEDGRPLAIPCRPYRWGRPGEMVELTYLPHTRQVLRSLWHTPPYQGERPGGGRDVAGWKPAVRRLVVFEAGQVLADAAGFGRDVADDVALVLAQ